MSRAKEYFQFQLESLKEHHLKQQTELVNILKEAISKTEESRNRYFGVMEEYRQLYEAINTKYQETLEANLELTRSLTKANEEINHLQAANKTLLHSPKVVVKT